MAKNEFIRSACMLFYKFYHYEGSCQLIPTLIEIFITNLMTLFELSFTSYSTEIWFELLVLLRTFNIFHSRPVLFFVFLKICLTVVILLKVLMPKVLKLSSFDVFINSFHIGNQTISSLKENLDLFCSFWLLNRHLIFLSQTHICKKFHQFSFISFAVSFLKNNC